MARKDLGNYFNYNNTYVEVNTLLEKSNGLVKILNRYNIPFKEHSEIWPNETNICVSHGADLKILYILAYLADKIYGNKIYLFIDYQDRDFLDYPECNKRYIYFGTCISQENNDGYLSQPILLKKIISLNLLKKEMSWNEFGALFPCKDDSNDIENTNSPDVDEKLYVKYSDSYAQDIEGLSDDFIDDALGGDPDAYWNID